jgi:hypothetical protein
MAETMDMASALEQADNFDDASVSQSFLALKALNLAKVKLLRGSIDSLQNKLKDATRENKGNQRSQLIQSLRNKLKDQGIIKCMTLISQSFIHSDS